ncbi:MAG: acyl-CoA dehydrogenase family protein [Panacagrimonas sp.]
MEEPTPLPQYFTHEHEQFRRSLRDFIAREVTPNVEDWEESGRFPRELYTRFGEMGFLGVGYPEALGGTPADAFYNIVIAEEFARCAAGGIQASINSHSITVPLLLAAGSPSLQQRLVPKIISGEWIPALAVTEPSGGSDVAQLRTTAIREGDHYIVNGEKTFITSGMRADVIITAVRIDPAAKGPEGISILAIDGRTPGLMRTELQKMGWWCSDTAHLHFDQCRVPISDRVGEEHRGFRAFMHNFNSERLYLAAFAYASAQVCFDEALDWARQRKTFGALLSERQVVRHKLMDMALKIDAARSLVHELTWRIQNNSDRPADLVARICMAKVLATQAMQFCADQAIQILGGMGYMRGTKSERIYREVKVVMIGGGSEEIMKDLAARQFGI